MVLCWIILNIKLDSMYSRTREGRDWLLTNTCLLLRGGRVTRISKQWNVGVGNAHASRLSLSNTISSMILCSFFPLFMVQKTSEAVMLKMANISSGLIPGWLSCEESKLELYWEKNKLWNLSYLKKRKLIC